MIKKVLTTALILVLLYLSFCFVLWQFNPQLWGVEKRGLFICCCILSSILPPFIRAFSEDFK
jgi:hypothetical protein